MDKIKGFLRSVNEQLKLICEGRYEATDEVLKFTDERENEPAVNELAETVGFMSIKLEAREMALEKTIDDLKISISEKKQFSLFFIMFTCFVVVFTFMMAFLSQAGFTEEKIDTLSTLIAFGFLILFIVMALVMIRFSTFSFSDFGLTLRGSRKAIRESMIVTIPALILMTLIRIWCGNNLEIFQGKPFFDTSIMGFAFWIYLFVAPAQEFIGRGVVQTVLYRLMAGKHKMMWAIILGSMIFGLSHTFFSFWIAILSVLSGFVWGWLFMRHGTIVGVAISHLIIGEYMELMGFWYLLQ